MTHAKILPLFRITHAVDWDDETTPDTAVPLAKPRSYGQHQTAGRHPEGIAFRLYDDDGNLCYRGRYYGTGPNDDGFEPLDWAMHDSGCTRIDYFEKQPNGTRRWCTL